VRDARDAWTATSYSSTSAMPPNAAAAPSRIALTRSALACMAFSVCHALVAMHFAVVRSTISDSPTNPLTWLIAGITVSRTCAIPASINGG